MLGHWHSQDEYQNSVRNHFKHYADIPDQLLEYSDIVSKLFILDTDRLKFVVEHCYSDIGRPAEQQPEIFRAYIAMQCLSIPYSQWYDKLNRNTTLRVACGFQKGDVPNTGSFYDFINRLDGPNVKPRVKKFLSKPKTKLKKGEKLPPKHPGVTNRLKNKLIKGHRFNDPTADILNDILSLSINKSLELGLITNNPNVSGDGTCVLTGAYRYGKKTCDCKSKGIYSCECARRFSDPTASWGWDSHNEKFFYGYSGYFLSTYNKTHKIDLPLYLRIVDAKRHDSVSALVSIAEYLDRYPKIGANAFISDSASDNYATYELLEEWNIGAVIALNKTNSGNCKYPVPFEYDEYGIPICPAGHKMVHWGSNKNDHRYRVKWRCPKALGRAEHCEKCDFCSKSPYGRVIYTKVNWDPRLFCRIPRGTDLWKQTMNERTAAERINNRILNNYGIEKSKRRGKKRISFDIMIATVNIHLDAQLKKMRADGSFDLFRDVVA